MKKPGYGPTQLVCPGREFSLSRPLVMGILNVTPDSFSDGGALFSASSLNLDALCRVAETMVVAGASFLDIGGESTRPGALAVSEQEEMDRVLGAITCVKSRFDVEISLDSSSPNVMLAGAAAGVGLINDVRALGRDGAVEAAAKTGLPICLMHMQGDPLTMQQGPKYVDVVSEVTEFLEQRAAICSAAGIPRERLIFDPGFGFGKSPEHNFSLLKRLPEVAALGQPVLVGLSRKSMIASVIDRDTTQRMPASLALAVLAMTGGAHILRVHDVGETMDAVAMMTAFAEASL